MEGHERFIPPQTPEEVPESEFHTPYYEATLEKFSKQMPEQREELKTVLDEIDRQGIENFHVFQSEQMPGVAFSYTKLTITPELLHRLSTQETKETQHAPTEPLGNSDEKTEGKEEHTKAKRQDYFLFSAFGLPPDGNAFTVQDVAIDRYMRLLPRVANALKRGEEPPEVNIYLLGAPTGFGGSVTPEWIDSIKQHGLEGSGQLYAEFVTQHEPPENLDKAHIVLQGVSRGAIIAEQTSRYLPERLQSSTQRLLDNPAGDHQGGIIHRWLKGSQVAVGLGAETVSRLVLDDTMKSLMKKGGPFLEKLSEKNNIPKDTTEQAKLKQSAAFAEGVALLKGSPLDTENTRSFIRRGIYDPLTFSPKLLMEIREKQNQGIPIPMFKKGRSLEIPFKGNHFFIYNRYNRWSKILNYIK